MLYENTRLRKISTNAETEYFKVMLVVRLKDILAQVFL